MDVEKTEGDLSVRSIVTVGMENALRVGDPVPQTQPIGTINLLCLISVPLTECAFLEAMSIAVEARTAVVLESHIPSFQTGFRATGTGTDCIVIAAPARPAQSPLEYAGKHTPVGSLIGRSVLEVMKQGLMRISQLIT
ncbi:MAG: adenosylcobinamide amidohydrolase [Candidatus Omnitrophica bacterium]|nr:adenosylcobinamide amidohydrolase [Candidatus Omnitrophota bacterium]